MKINIYPLTKSHLGYVPSSTLLASVTIDKGLAEIECFDGALRQKISSIFETPFYSRFISGDLQDNFTFYYREVTPKDKEFTDEVLMRLRRYSLYGLEVSEKS